MKNNCFQIFLQDVTDDSERPHVGCATNGLIADDFGGDKFGSAEKDPHRSVRVQLPGQTEIDQLDAMRIRALTKDIFRLNKSPKINFKKILN